MNKRWLTVGMLFTAAAIICFLLMFRSCTDEVPQPTETDAKTSAVTTTAKTPVSTAASAMVGTTAATETAYADTVDFDALTAQNPDVYAWLEVAGSDIAYPVVQSAVDDSFYLNHGMDGKYDSRGMIFSEHRYNGKDFTDPVTILYGHRRKDMTMFSQLQPLYSDRSYFEQHREIVVHLPDRALHYRIIAAVPFDDRHILYEYDFTKAKDFAAFFDTVFRIRTIGANMDESAYPDYDDRILILSTCLWGDKNQRYLVIAVQQPADE